MEEKAIHRIFVYLESQNIPHTRFEKEIGLSNGYLNTQRRRNANLGEGVLKLIVDNCLKINIGWLLTGKGEMLKSEDGIAQQSDVVGNNIGVNTTIDALQKVIMAQEKTINSLEEQIGLMRQLNMHNKQ